MKDELKLLSVLYEASRSGRGGEVVMRSGENSARAFFVAGRIAWVTASTVKRTFTQYLKEKAGLKAEEVQEVFEECRRKRTNFGETIVEWGLTSQETLRRLLLEHLTECLVEVLSWESVESMFVPEERAYSGTLLFSFEELLESALASPLAEKLALAGMGREQVMGLLQSEREPTMPFMPAFAAAQEAEMTERDGQVSARRASGNKNWRRFFGFALAVLVLAAGSFYVLEYLDAERQGEAVAQSAAPNDAGPAEPGQAAPLDAGSPAEPKSAADGRDGAATAEEPAPPPAPVAPPPASLRLSSNPSGALVYLDALSTGKKTPCLLEGLAPGGHLVLLERKGSAPAFAKMELSAGESHKLHLKLPRKDKRFRGRQKLVVESEPPGALIAIDNAASNQRTPAELSLRLDRPTRLALEAPGHKKWRQMVRPAPGEKTSIKITLEKISREAEK